MPTQHAAIPTVYKGVQMRSRLEARWAAFFDLCGWQWSYEPLDLDGWIPDFMLHGAKSRVFVEVKPIDWTNIPTKTYPNGHKSRYELETYFRSMPDLAKIFDKTDSEILICGAFLPPDEFSVWGDADIFAGIVNDGGDFAVLSAGENGSLDFHANINSYLHRISGEYDGDHHLCHPGSGVSKALWDRAGNAVQYKSPRKRAR